MNKKVISIFFLLALSLFPFLVLAQLPNSNPEIIRYAIMGITNIVWMIFAGLAVIMFIWAGILFLIAQGEPSKIAQARQFVIWGIVGVGVALISASVLLIIKGALQV